MVNVKEYISKIFSKMKRDKEVLLRASKYRHGVREVVRYWNWAAKTYGREANGFKATCVCGAPDAINEYHDHLQKKLITPLLRKRKMSIVLDAGCGLGKWTRRLCDLGFSPVGCDISPNMIGIAKERLRNVPFAVCSLSHLCFRSQVFDTVLSVAVLQCITDPQMFRDAISEIARVTKSEGMVILWEQIGEIHHGYEFESRPLELYATILKRYNCKIMWWRGVSVTPHDLVLGIISQRFNFLIRLVSLYLSAIDLVITRIPYFSRMCPTKVVLIKKGG